MAIVVLVIVVTLAALVLLVLGLHRYQLSATKSNVDKHSPLPPLDEDNNKRELPELSLDDEEFDHRSLDREAVDSINDDNTLIETPSANPVTSASGGHSAVPGAGNSSLPDHSQVQPGPANDSNGQSSSDLVPRAETGPATAQHDTGLKSTSDASRPETRIDGSNKDRPYPKPGATVDSADSGRETADEVTEIAIPDKQIAGTHSSLSDPGVNNPVLNDPPGETAKSDLSEQPETSLSVSTGSDPVRYSDSQNYSEPASPDSNGEPKVSAEELSERLTNNESPDAGNHPEATGLTPSAAEDGDTEITPPGDTESGASTWPKSADSSSLGATDQNGPAADSWQDEVAELKKQNSMDLALQVCHSAFPLWSAYQQASLIHRARLKQLAQSGQNIEPELKALYNLAAQASLLHDRVKGLPNLPLARLKRVDLDEIEQLEMPYKQIGYNELRLIKKTDIKLLLDTWGKPQAHKKPRELHEEVWKHLMATHQSTLF